MVKTLKNVFKDIKSRILVKLDQFSTINLMEVHYYVHDPIFDEGIIHELHFIY